MTTGYVGADPDQLDALGRSLEDGADRIDVLRSGLSMDLFYGGWIGPDAEGARAEWEHSHGPALAAAAGLLTVMGTSARAHAAAQREASAGDAMLQQGDGWPPIGYPGDGDPEALRQYWLGIALANAGIDMSKWDPSLGAGNQSAIIEAVYTYYANLYLENDYFLWAGMAAMVGPSFAGGFYDLNYFRNIAAVLSTLDIGPIGGPGMTALAGITDTDLHYYETTLLQMQQDIFVDQAVMHEAYLAGGMAGIQDLYDAGIIDQPTLEAWQAIDEGRATGNHDLVESGNEQLLMREQRDIIQGYYDQMYNHGVTGPAFTYVMGAIGASGIPNTMTFGQWDPLVVSVDLLNINGSGPIGIPFIDEFGINADITTPLPDGNLAIFNDRWEYISGDTLVRFQELVEQNPALAEQILGTPVGERIEEYRLGNRIDDLLAMLTSDWGAGLSIR